MNAEPRVGTSVYTADGHPAGQIESTTGDEFVLNGRTIMNELLDVGPDGRYTIRYTAAQLAWQGGAAPDAHDAITDDPAGEGELANMIEEQRRHATEG